MTKIVTVHYTDTQPSSTTISSGPLFQTSTVAPSGMKPAITITGGNRYCVRVPFLSEGFLSQLVVKQSTGTSLAYVVELLMSGMPYAAGSSSVATPATGTIQLFRVIPQQAVLAGSTLDISPDTELGWPFRNVDGDHTNNQRYLYLVITPTYVSADITLVSLTDDVVTITAVGHPFSEGDSVTISGLTAYPFLNGTYTITSVPSADTFTFDLEHDDVAEDDDIGTASVAETKWNAMLMAHSNNSN